MKREKKISVVNFALFQALLFSLIGLVVGFIYSFGGFILDALVSMDWITSSETPGLSYGTILAFGALIGMPAIFGAIGVVTGFIEAILFNRVVRWFKWINLNFEK